MNRHTSPVSLAVFPHLTLVLLDTSVFFIPCLHLQGYPTSTPTPTQCNWHIYKELLIFLVASLFMGFQVRFLLLWVSMCICTLEGSSQTASLNPGSCKLIFFFYCCWECPTCCSQ
uniref:Dolichyl-diphosphooligosaccharide-protein glycosyltransferase subunit TMEM258 n=1 Tax=Suricata suricatta TaxID=37032 RepID=A0A673SPU1_SURSU